MKFQPISTKNIIIWLASGAIAGAIGLWSASLSFERVVGKRVTADGVPVVVTVDRPNKNRLLFLSIAMGLIGAAALATLVVDDKGDRLLCPETLTDDIGDASKVLANNLGCALLFVSGKGFRWAFGKQSVARQITLSVLPVEIRDRMKELVSKKDWFKDFLSARRHYILCGSTGDGKSMMLNAIIITFLQNAQANISNGISKDRLAICDLNYGKRDEKGNLNTWLDLPREYIAATVDEIMLSVRSVIAELRDRRQDDIDCATAKSKDDDAKYKALEAKSKQRGNVLLVIEEQMSTRAAIKSVDTELLKEFDASINEILRYGRGYLVKVLIVLQYLNAGKGDEGNGINLGLRDQCCIALLKTMAVQKNQVEKISTEPDELVSQFKEALKKFPYLALVQNDGGSPNIRQIPDLSWTSGFSIKKTVDSVDVWWSQVWTEANQQWVLDLIERGRSPKSSAFDSEIKTRFGIGRNAKDPRYQKYKAAIAQIEAKQKQLTGV